MAPTPEHDWKQLLITLAERQDRATEVIEQNTLAIRELRDTLALPPWWVRGVSAAWFSLGRVQRSVLVGGVSVVLLVWLADQLGVSPVAAQEWLYLMKPGSGIVPADVATGT